MTGWILLNIVSGGMCCYSQFAFSHHYTPSKNTIKNIKINNINIIKYIVWMIFINKNSSNKFILWR